MKIALLFPGYGSQFVGMGKELYDEYRIVQEYFEEASSCANINFVKLCFASSDVELGKLAHAYMSLFLIGACTYAVLKEHAIEPDIVAGYNNGESSALFAAGCFSLPDGLYLLNKFSSFYQEFIDNNNVEAIRVAGIEAKQLEKICKKASNDEGKAFVAIHNSSTDHIVAGNRTTLELVQDAIGEEGQVEYVGAEVGLHSELMNEVVAQFKDYLEKVDFKDLKIPMLSCIDGAVITQGVDTKERFISHINSPLEFTRVITQLADYDCILVASPADKLAVAVMQQYPDKMVRVIARKEDVDKLKEILDKQTL